MTEKEIKDRAKYKKNFDRVFQQWKTDKEKEIKRRIEYAISARQPTDGLKEELNSLLAFNPDSNDVYGTRGSGGLGIANGNDRDIHIIGSLNDLFSRSGFAVEGSVVGDWINKSNTPGATAVPKTAGHRLNRDYLVDEDSSIGEESEAPSESTPTTGQSSSRLTTATTPAEFKPALMEKEKGKTEEEYLSKDRSKWVNMSTADKVDGF